MDTDTLITAITAAFTIALPVVVQWRKQPEWSKLLKVGLPVAASLVIAVAYLVATEALAGLSFLAAFLIVYGLQQLVYATIIKNIAGLMSSDGRHEAITQADTDDTDVHSGDHDAYPIGEAHGPTQADPERYTP
ncbi:hypothetical protein ACFY5D_03755 [Paeniglutamicibacter sp. NPDC012692]|uniref:hypothetical protein n=1 Tax=Paeniglutamicibacter sp. NPDC012692 TaxID=3364388 RepID=UPI0036AFE057